MCEPDRVGDSALKGSNVGLLVQSSPLGMFARSLLKVVRLGIGVPDLETNVPESNLRRIRLPTDADYPIYRHNWSLLMMWRCGVGTG